jgi:hypothetical protein
MPRSGKRIDAFDRRDAERTDRSVSKPESVKESFARAMSDCNFL